MFLFYFDDGVDTGDIISQNPSQNKDTIKDVLNKTTNVAKEVLLEKMPEIQNGSVKVTKQDHSKATIFPKRSPKDGEINWEWDTNRIKNFINAQTRPYPGAFTFINDKKVIIWDADILDSQ